jgi:hypothetical protein
MDLRRRFVHCQSKGLRFGSLEVLIVIGRGNLQGIAFVSERSSDIDCAFDAIALREKSGNLIGTELVKGLGKVEGMNYKPARCSAKASVQWRAC